MKTFCVFPGSQWKPAVPGPTGISKVEDGPDASGEKSHKYGETVSPSLLSGRAGAVSVRIGQVFNSQARERREPGERLSGKMGRRDTPLPLRYPSLLGCLIFDLWKYPFA